MDSLFIFLVRYQTWIYVILGLILAIYLKKLLAATQDWNATIFGLERDYAQKKLNTALVMVVVTGLLLAAEFVSVNYLISDLPAFDPLTGAALTTAEVDVEIVSEAQRSGAEDIQGGLGGFAGGCQAGVLEWISPSPSEVVSGLYTLKATVNVPEMGFFRYDYAPINDPSRWNAILAGNLPVIEGTLGPLATTEIENGDYILRLEVLSKTNEAWAPCDVSIRIMNETEE